MRSSEAISAGGAHGRSQTAAATARTTRVAANAAQRLQFGPVPAVTAPVPAASGRTLQTRTGSAMFLTVCSPRSSNAMSTLPLVWSRTAPVTQMPPGSARASIRAAMLTPSP